MKKKWWLVLLLLVAGTIHIGSLGNGFYWDDRPLIVEGKLIRSLESIPTIFAREMWHNVDLGARATQAEVDTYRPISTLSFLFDYHVWALQPVGYHLTNLFIHLATVLLFALLLLRITSPPTAFLAAAIFALHPLTAEPIEYVSARTDSLPAFFGLLGFFFVLGRKARNVAAGFCFLFALLAKETGLAFSVAWLFFLLIRRENDGRGRLDWIYPVGVMGIYFGMRHFALGASKSLMDLQHALEWFENFPRFVLLFARQFLVPMSNFPMQEVVISRFPGSLLGWFASLAFYCGVAFLVAWSVRRRKEWGALLVGFLFSLAIPFVAVSLTTETSPRYFYTALLPASYLLALLLTHIPVSRKVFTSLIVTLLFSISFVSYGASKGYRTEEQFYRSILQENPNSRGGVYNLANTLARSGRFLEAIDFYKRLAETNPKDPQVWNNLGVSCLNVGKLKGAKKAFERALRLSPGNRRYEKNLLLVTTILQQK